MHLVCFAILCETNLVVSEQMRRHSNVPAINGEAVLDLFEIPFNILLALHHSNVVFNDVIVLEDQIICAFILHVNSN